MTTLKYKLVKTRKEHSCWLCLEKIEVESQAYSWTCVSEGQINSGHYCHFCDKLIAEHKTQFDDYEQGCFKELYKERSLENLQEFIEF